MWLSVVPQIICCFLAYRVVEPKYHGKISGNVFIHLKEAYLNFIRNKKLRLLSLSHILGYSFGEASYQFQSAFYSTLWPLWAIGIAKTLSNIGAAISFSFAGRITNRFNRFKILIADNLYSRLINIVSVAFPSVLSPLLMPTTSLFFGVTSVAKNSLFQKEFSDGQRATMGSLNAFVGSIFFGIIAVMLGLVADKLSPAKALLVFQIIQFVNLWVYWKLFKQHSDN